MIMIFFCQRSHWKNLHLVFFCKKKLSYQQQDVGQITNILLLVYFSKYFSPNKFEFAIGFPWGKKRMNGI